MKHLLLAAIASTFLFACSNENENDNSNIPEQGVVFELATVNQLQTTNGTRSRQLYSQEAVQEIDSVCIYVFKNNNTNYVYEKTYTIPQWSKGTAFQRFTVPSSDPLLPGSYQFLVLGQEKGNNYTFTTPVTGTTQITDMTASITAPGNESEFFTGNKDVTVTAEGIRVNIDMTRKIAGVLGYFKNVPVTLNNKTVKFLRVTVTQTNNNVLIYNGAGTGTTSTTAYNIIDVDLSGQTIDTDAGVYAGNDLSAAGVVKVSDSQLFGKFIIPVNSISMSVGLYDSNNVLIKKWDVQNDNNPVFNLLANNFYALGQKVTKGDTTGGGTPGTGDDDAPIDLLKDQVIAITIDANWNSVHNLFIQ